MTSAGSAHPLRPTRPVAGQPTGYVQLAHYSSLSYLWRLLAGASQAGHKLSMVRGDTTETARRRISGYTLAGAGAFVDTAPLLRELEDGFALHPALVALVAGDSTPLKTELNRHYQLQLDFVVALSANRDFLCRPEFRFVPLASPTELANTLPADLPLRARRFGRDELHLLLLRACGLA